MSFVSSKGLLEISESLSQSASNLFDRLIACILFLQVDATDENNKALASKYEIQGFPTLKVRLGVYFSPDIEEVFCINC